jgi:ribonuclease Z
MRVGEYTIEGASSSAFATYIGVKELDILFDIGHCPPHFTRYDNLLITHGHQDHLLSITRYIGLRNMNNMAPPNIYLPAVQMENVQNLLRIWSKIENRRNYSVNLIPVQAGETYEINDKYYFKAFKTPHSFDSLGYIIYEKRKKLKPELVGKSPQELIKMKKNGEEIEYFLHIPQICFTGDATEEIIRYPEIQETRYLILETTFISEDHLEAADDKAHIHLTRILDFLREAPNKYIILTHFSMRYHKKEARELVRKIVGDLFEKKIFTL